MSLFTPASQVLERNAHYFAQQRVYFAGDIQDDYPAKCSAKSAHVHCTQYHHFRRLHALLAERAEFGLLPNASHVENSDFFLFYWYKNKRESEFQLMALLSQINVGDTVFIVGENRSGVRHAEKCLSEWGNINKIDTARRCSLYAFELQKAVPFQLDGWWTEYVHDTIRVKALPGVFSQAHLDAGSALLLSALQKNPEMIKGKVLDFGCGAGILGSLAAKLAPNEIELTFADVNAAALASTKATIAANHITAHVVASDRFSDLRERYHLIITNPPFHEGRNVDYSTTENFIREAQSHLPIGGKLCLVANGFLPYPAILEQVFGSYEILAETTQFKVYLAEMRLSRR